MSLVIQETILDILTQNFITQVLPGERYAYQRLEVSRYCPVLLPLGFWSRITFHLEVTRQLLSLQTALVSSIRTKFSSLRKILESSSNRQNHPNNFTDIEAEQRGG
jgi:hypothetical protein